MQYSPGEEQTLVFDYLRTVWTNNLSSPARTSKDDFVGVLRSILGTMEQKRSSLPDSRLYLQYVTEFLKRRGISAHVTDHVTEEDAIDSPQPALPAPTSEPVDIDD